MFRLLNNRAGHHALLIAVCAVLYLPNLGGPSLWDVDEGRNCACSQAMLESGDYVMPRFNGELRTDKPAGLYWLQAEAYRAFGVSEFAGRLPSALAALVTVLLTYELGRRVFDAATGLMAGLILASALLFCAAGHFANPDALLNTCTVLTFLSFWLGYSSTNGRWLIAGGVASGLGVLAKGPVAIVLPFAACGLFLLWSRRLRFLWTRYLAWGSLACALVFAPWYTWVGVETKAEFLRAFFLTHNVERFLQPMENHSGAPAHSPWAVSLGVRGLYYPLVLVIGLAPWSVFLLASAWSATGRRARADAAGLPADALPAPYRFLWCWIAAYLVFFMFAGTKLPNYVLPMYGPAAVLLARFLERWRRGAIKPPPWQLPASLIGFGLVGVLMAIGLLIVGGTLPVPLPEEARLPGAASWAAVGVLPVAGAIVSWWLVRRQQRGPALAALAGAAVACVSLLAGGGAAAVDAVKAPRPLVQTILREQRERDIRLVCYDYFEPSLVFYAGRQVTVLDSDLAALQQLRYPVEVFLLLPADDWQRLQGQVRTPCRLLAEHRDLYRRCDVVVVTNR
jgi:4-amino-4-deoxy-L-arabinose transferase-like glycosyltransferase